MCVQIVFKLVEVYSCFTEKAHNHLQQLKRSFSPLLHLQLSGPATILPLSPLSPFSRLCPLASFLLAAGQLGSGPPWLGSGVASAGQEGGGEVGRGGEGGGQKRGDDEDSVPQATQEGVRQKKIGNKHVRSRKVGEKKKKTTALSLTPLSLSLHLPHLPSSPLSLSLFLSWERPGRAWPERHLLHNVTG